ncbi:MAG: hypothetical protein H7Y88_11970 [Phycisphaerales bacterium]|nr:hypothetical protein [Phycisphaerales bacterium]
MRFFLVVLSSTLFGLLGSGCSSPGGDLALYSESNSVFLTGDWTTAVYATTNNDPNTADVYLTDLPRERVLSEGDLLAGASGSVIHIHLFLVPKAGMTPIEASACNMTVRQVVLAGSGAAGLYGGGGFLQPDSRPGKEHFSGSIFDATLKLLRSSGGFPDLLDGCTMRGDFDAVRDEQAARALAARIEAIVASMQIVDDPGVAPPDKAATAEAAPSEAP